jgi:hypothetical protein
MQLIFIDDPPDLPYLIGLRPPISERLQINNLFNPFFVKDVGESFGVTSSDDIIWVCLVYLVIVSKSH